MLTRGITATPRFLSILRAVPLDTSILSPSAPIGRIGRESARSPELGTHGFDYGAQGRCLFLGLVLLSPDHADRRNLDWRDLYPGASWTRACTNTAVHADPPGPAVLHSDDIDGACDRAQSTTRAPGSVHIVASPGVRLDCLGRADPRALSTVDACHVVAGFGSLDGTDWALAEAFPAVYAGRGGRIHDAI